MAETVQRISDEILGKISGGTANVERDEIKAADKLLFEKLLSSIMAGENRVIMPHAAYIR
jgi:hypothetical protein